MRTVKFLPIHLLNHMWSDGVRPSIYQATWSLCINLLVCHGSEKTIMAADTMVTTLSET